MIQTAKYMILTPHYIQAMLIDLTAKITLKLNYPSQNLHY